MKTVLDLSANKALTYFLQSDNYCTLSLPIYFDFGGILEFVQTKVGQRDFSQCLKESTTYPSAYENVNYNLLVNKDGRYAYRPLQLANPFLYYFLARDVLFHNRRRDGQHLFTVCGCSGVVSAEDVSSDVYRNISTCEVYVVVEFDHAELDSPVLDCTLKECSPKTRYDAQFGWVEELTAKEI